MTKFDLHQVVTDKIIASIEAGAPAWVKPWNANGLPHNIVTKKPYKGINTLLLAMNAYQSTEWASYKQWADKGAQVRKGETGSMIVYNTKIEKEEIINGLTVKKDFWLLRYYTVFNAEQVDGYTLETSDKPAFNPIEKCESVLSDWEQYITYTDNDKAFYSPAMDAINMPKRENFKNNTGFYATAFHELAHLTGHESRLNRFEITNRFGSEGYAFEELIAEIASAFINHACGIDSIQNHDSYIASWLKVLKNDKKAIFKASSMAVKASDMILKNNTESLDTE